MMRTTTLLMMATVSIALSGCVGGGLDIARDMGDRFVEQVNTNTCDEASGFEIDDVTWQAACEATVADLGDGSSLSDPDTRYGGLVETDYDVVFAYRNADGVPSSLRISLDGEGGFFSTGATLNSIASEAGAVLGGNGLPSYGRYGDPIEADGQALVGDVQRLLAAGDCAGIRALMAPVGEFPDSADVGECAAAATLYAAHPPTPGEGEWYSHTYSTYNLMTGDEEAYGIPQRRGENRMEYRERVLDAIHDTNRIVKLDVDSLNIEVVLYEDQWYLSNIRIGSQNFYYRFE